MEFGQPPLTALDVKRNLFPDNSSLISNQLNQITKTTAMATLTQPVHAANTKFSPIKSPIDDNTETINGSRVSISKIKSQQTTMSNMISPKSSTNSGSLVVNSSPKVNGTISPKPYTTTSQNKPPKFKLLNRSTNVASPVKEVNGLDDTDALNDNLEDKQPETELTADETLTHTTPQNGVKEDTEKPMADTSSTKNQTESTTTTSYRHTALQHQQQHSGEYASPPSSSSSSLNRENSLDYKDSTGVDLHEFMVKTLRDNPRDRLMLLKLERDFTEFIEDQQKTRYKYNQMTSYHRMLVHRVAAYFGLDHNIDNTGKAVIISKLPSSRVPETKFQSYCSREYTDEEISSPKSILPRSASSDDQGAGTPSSSFDSEHSNANQSAAFSPTHITRTTDKSLTEREAAIAAVAAKTGGKSSSGNITKRNKNFDLPLHQTVHSSHHWVNEINVSSSPEIYGYTSGGGGGVTYTGGSISQVDSTHPYYHSNYPAQIAYVGGNAGYITQQQAQQHQGNLYHPVYYVPGNSPNQNPTLATPSNNPSIPSQYCMHQTATGQFVYVPRQAGVNDGNVQMISSQQQIHYQDLTTQMGSVAIEQNSSSRSATDGAQSDKQQQMTSPTSPIVEVATTPTADYQTSSRKHIVYLQSEQVTQPQYPNSVPGYPVQYYQNVPHAYQTYQDPNIQLSANSPQTATPSNLQPPASPTATGLLQQHFSNAIVSQSPLVPQTPPQQYIQAAQSGQMTGHRPRFPGPGNSMVYHQRGGGNPIYVPVAQPQQVAMLISAGQFLNAPKNYEMYRTNSKGNSINSSVPGIENTDYRKLDPQQQQAYALQQHAHSATLSLAQQHRPLVQISPNYHQAYAYMSSPPKRFMNPVMPNQYVRSSSPGQKRYRPHRNPAGNQQIRISRPYSQTSDNEQNTVGHILEIFDFPENIASDLDPTFDDVRSSGARILKINSSSQSSNQNGAVVKPTILAIFKSSSEAQKALETVRNPHYKLRVSKKSPTHLSSSDYPNNSSSNQTKTA